MKKDLFERMLELDPDFRAFVEAQKDKTTEEIAIEYGIKMPLKSMNLSRICHRKQKVPIK